MPMPRSKGPNSVQVSINLPPSWVDELDALASSLSEPGAERDRSTVLRQCIRRGIDAMTPDPPKKSRK
jgi:predicted DNA-binding protein